jgi:putative holliday junction resolvase
MRYLGIDLGDKRTGLAVGDDQLRMAVPARVLEMPAGQRDSLLAALERAIEDHLGNAAAPGELVIGLPMNMDGTEGGRARAARDFAALLAARTGRRVHLQDERLTTAAADWSLARTGLTHKQKKERRDAIAAAALLQGFLNALPKNGE